MIKQKSSPVQRKQTPDQQSPHLDAVAELFGVLSESTRLRILQHLQQGPSTVSGLVDALGIRQANASKHLGILYQAGLLKRERDGNLVRYSIRMRLVFKLCDLVCDELHRGATERVARLFPRQTPN